MGHVINFSTKANPNLPPSLPPIPLNDVLSPTLLQALSTLRDVLDTEVGLDLGAVRDCQAATKHAMNTAMRMERDLVRQSLHIEEMTRLAQTDRLTGIYNRRGFEIEFDRVLSAATRYGETGALIFLDLDGFKPINDTYGHAAGDRVLCQVAEVMQENLRAHDLVARFGGDEFAILLTRISWEQAQRRTDILKQALNTHYVPWKDRNIAVKASLGFQRFGPGDDAKDLLRQADDSMYKAKRLRATTAATAPTTPPTTHRGDL